MNIPSSRRDRRQIVLGAIAPLVLVAAITAWNLAHKSIWVDEAYSLSTAAHHPLPETIRRAIRFELQPPLYFGLLNLWLRISPGLGFGRAFSMLCSMGTVLFLWASARQLQLRNAWVISWLAALTPGVIWAASEMRGYALGMLLVAASGRYFLRVTREGPPRTRDLAAYAVTALAALLTYYYAGFVLAGHWLAAMIAKRNRRQLTIALAIAAVSFMPFVPTVIGQVVAHPNPVRDTLASSPPRLDLYHARMTWLQGVIGEHAVTVESPNLIFLLIVSPLILIPGVPGLVRRSPSAGITGEGNGQTVLVIVAALVPLLAIGMLRATSVVLVEARHTLIALPPFLLMSVALVSGTRWRVPAGACLVALVGAVSVSLAIDEHTGLQTADWKSAGAYLSAHALIDEPILVSPSYDVLPLAYYYPRTSAIVQIPGAIRFDTADFAPVHIRDTAQLARSIDSAVRHGRFWMVEGRTEFSKERLLLNTFLESRYRTIADSSVLTIRMQHLEAR